MQVSILICTRNRSAHLRDTLRSLSTVRIPEDLAVELLIVDNGSTDATSDVVEAEAPASLSPRRVYEGNAGLSKARNTAVAAATGDILLFTDDDVRVPPDWVERVCTPFRDGAVDAVAGGVRLALALRRPWMTPLHLGALADTSPLEDASRVRLVGANMAVRRRVFDRIPAFDTELGAGPHTHGFHEETLFSLQLIEAGGRVARAYDTVVEHHPDPSRLTVEAFTGWADKLGRSDAYVDYHWRHASASRVRSAGAVAYWSGRLAAEILNRWAAGRSEEQIPAERLEQLRFRGYHRHMLSLAGTPRQYARHGLEKRRVEAAFAPAPTGLRRPAGSQKKTLP